MVYLAAFREDGVITSIYNKVKEGDAPQYLYNTETKEAGEDKISACMHTCKPKEAGYAFTSNICDKEKSMNEYIIKKGKNTKD
jgi:hypothetical protein